MAALPKNPKKNQTVTLKAPSGTVKATWNGKSWDYKTQKAAPAPAPSSSTNSKPGSVNNGIGFTLGQTPPQQTKSRLDMTRGEQDRADAAAATAAIQNAKREADRKRAELLRDAYSEKGLTALGNRTAKKPGLQPRDSELATLRENAKKDAAEKFNAYLNEKVGMGPGSKTRREYLNYSAPSGSNATTTQSGADKAFGPTRKAFGEQVGKSAPSKGTVLERAAKAFSGSDPALAGVKGAGDRKDVKAFSKTNLTKDEFNRFKNVYRRTHKGDVSDTYLQVMARYVKSKGTKTKAFGTYKFKGS